MPHINIYININKEINKDKNINAINNNQHLQSTHKPAINNHPPNSSAHHLINKIINNNYNQSQSNLSFAKINIIKINKIKKRDAGR
jgi:hypothetical protein